jgi:hypothetical protein
MAHTRIQSFKALPITFEETTNAYLIESILNEPKLFELRTGEPLRRDLKNKESIQFGHKYLLAKKGNEIVGLINYQLITPVTLSVHMNVLPQYWSKQVSYQITDEFKAIVTKAKCFNKVICTVPSRARHVSLFVRRIGMTLEATLKDAVTYKMPQYGSAEPTATAVGKLDNLNIFSLEIKN